jgi:hypothetical protein
MAQTTVDAGPDFLSAWLRVPVRNDLKRDAAEDVEVFLNSVRSGPSAEQLEDRELAGFALAWTAVDGTKVLISPGATRHINVGFVIPVVPGFTEPRFQLAVSGGLPRGGRAVWSLPVAEIELVVSARNASAMLVRFGVTLAPDGDVTAEVLG